MPKPIVLVSHFPSGGTCKSTSSVNIAAYLALKFDVLLLDLDGGQCTATNAVVNDLPTISAYELIKGEATLLEGASPCSSRFPPQLRVIAGSPRLTSLDAETAVDRNYWLADRIEGQDTFDFIVIDTPPAMGAATIMALMCLGARVITPVATEPKCIEQLPAWGRFFSAVSRMNPTLSWLGLLPTRHDGRNRLGQECLENLNGTFSDIVLPPIRATVRLRETLAQGLPPWAQASPDYLITTNHILRRLNYAEEILEGDCLPKTH